ncbi:Oxidoreductase, molybdopterin-binding domain-containing protein [Hyaloraphidium curvatum]|nr:Oxidoreductase, molybdopterin-binding domain-containing protein [Hyaloraphidium curvatum]
MSILPGAFPDDEPPARREVVLSEKGRREEERKRKTAEKAAEFADKWEGWKKMGAKEWSERVYKPEPGQETSKTNPRISPGNHLSRRFQVMDLDFQPDMDIDFWELTVSSHLGTVKLNLEDIRELGEQTYVADFHCVTRWSAFDVQWTGVPFSRVMERCRHVIPPGWKVIYETSADGYTTNVQRRDVERDDVWLVYGLNGQIPIPLEHGTVRILKPHLYAWVGAR